MAIGPMSAGASRLAVKIAVGPSAPPMMPIDAALCGEKPSARAPEEGDEDADLRGGAEQQALGVRQQGREVGHRADAQEDERREDAGADAEVDHPHARCCCRC